jgi:hypothetical protein
MASKHTPIIVTVADHAIDKIDEVAKQLGAKGMKVERVLPITGVITGSYLESGLSKLKKVEGVASVEPEAIAELPPSGSRVQ